MSIEETLKSFLSKSAEVSKNAFTKAGDAVQEFSDKSVVKLDKKKLEMQKSKKLSELGALAYDAFTKDNKSTFSSSDEAAKLLIDELKVLDKQIEEKEELLSEAENK